MVQTEGWYPRFGYAEEPVVEKESIVAIDRRELLTAIAGTSASAAMAPSRAMRHIRPGAPDWTLLRGEIGERLIPVRSPLEACARAGGSGADALLAQCRNPYFLGDEPGLTQTFGWIDAWTTEASTAAVAAETPADVSAAIRFARQHGVRLVVKGGGHSYFGNSNAAQSLLIWTRRMNAVRMHDSFLPEGSPPSLEPVAAVSVGAGAIWGHVYDAVAVKAGRYVQGGGCLTVGVAGFVQGGGFGSFSKQFGTGAANLLEAEVVTADGRVRVVNRHQEPELFFALRGGGGGTFGVVTRLTLRTHALPATLGGVLFSVTASNDEAWQALVERAIAFYAKSLFNPTWGEQMRFSPNRTLSVSMLFQGLSEAEARATWQPFLASLAERPGDFAMKGDPIIVALPGRDLWDPATLKKMPGLVLQDDRAGAPAANIFWASNREEAGQVLHAYQSAWLPAELLRPARQRDLASALIRGSSAWSMTLHMNKGLAGGSIEARALTAETATSPDVLDAFALLICAAEGPPAWPGIPGHEPDTSVGRQEASAVHRAMGPIRQLVPNAGAYVSEADYFDPDWERRYWGRHYPRLLAAKRRYDPAGIFHGRHTVGA